MRKGTSICGNAADGLLRYTGSGTFEGTVRLPDGTYAKQSFKNMSETDARVAWADWKAEVSGGSRADASGPAETPPPPAGDEVVGRMGSCPLPEDVFVLLSAGKPIFLFDDASVAESALYGLQRAAELSGLTVSYELARCGRWPE